jgi:hypothetical protein
MQLWASWCLQEGTATGSTPINDARRQGARMGMALSPAAAWSNASYVQGQAGYESRMRCAVSYFASFIGLRRERQGGIAVRDYASTPPIHRSRRCVKGFQEGLRGRCCLSTSHLFDGLTIMSLPFSALCELWEQLSSTRKINNSDAFIRVWFERQAPNIIQQGRSAVALLSCLFPHRRPDRVYGLRERKLTDITVRAWGTGQQPAQRAAETSG